MAKGPSTRFIPAPDADATITELAKPQCMVVAEAIANGIPANVPVHHGVMLRSYNPSTAESDQGAKVLPNSPFWHWLEYGTQYNQPYRPVENTIRQLGIRYEAQ
jgi:hypothetical protein